jgi:hypothetical protein
MKNYSDIEPGSDAQVYAKMDVSAMLAELAQKFVDELCTKTQFTNHKDPVDNFEVTLDQMRELLAESVDWMFDEGVNWPDDPVAEAA